MDTKNIFTKTFQKKAPEKPTKQATTPTIEKPLIAENPKNSKTSTPARRESASVSMFDSENIVHAIHKAKEENQRITVDVPLDIYKSMKVHLAHENVSIRDFVVRLIDVYLTKNQIK